MELRNPSNGETLEEPPNPSDGGKGPNPTRFQPFSDDIDSNCSTPYVSAPSSPGRNPSGYYFSAPASPMHYVLSSAPFSALASGGIPAGSSEMLASAGFFEFGGANATGPMISADELFHNGQIRPVKLSSHLQRPQILAPLMDLNEEEEEDAKEGEMSGRGREMRLRSRSVHRRARSMSPMRSSRFQWQDEEEEEEKKDLEADPGLDLDPKENETVVPSDSSASSSRSSSSGRNSKRWIFLKDLLYRSKSEGRGRTSSSKEKEKEKFWHSISFSLSKEKSKDSKPPLVPISSESKEKMKNADAPSSATPSKRPTNGVRKRRGPLPSAHERHYTANRAQAEEMRKRTFLPYRQGLLGCLGFSSRSYGAMNGFAKTLNTVSLR